MVSSFEGLSNLGVGHFRESSIAKTISIAQLFPRFVEEEDNDNLMVEIMA